MFGITNLQDFKIIVKLQAGSYGPWSEGGHTPEADIIAGMGAIEGVSAIEQQTYTLEDM